MLFDDSFIMQKVLKWSFLNDGMLVLVSSYALPKYNKIR